MDLYWSYYGMYVRILINWDTFSLQLHCLSTLIHMLEENDVSVRYTVRRYVAMSLLEVFHKTLPAYHIRPHDLSQKCKFNFIHCFYTILIAVNLVSSL